MAIDYFPLAINVSQIVGSAVKRARLKIATNLPAGVPLAYGDEIAVPGGIYSLAGGVGEVELPTQTGVTNLDGDTLQYIVTGEYSVDGAVELLDPIYIDAPTTTAPVNLASFVGVTSVPPTFMGAAVAQLQAKVDEAEAIKEYVNDVSNIDSTVSAVDFALSQPGPAATLSAAIGAGTEAAITLERAQQPVNVRWFGTNNTAVRAAWAVARASGRGLYFSGGSSYSITGDLYIDQSRMQVTGDGDTTRLAFTDGSLVLDGRAATIQHTRIKDLQITRAGTVGPALSILGDGYDNTVARFSVDNVAVMSSTGDGVLVSGSYIGNFNSLYVQLATTSVRIVGVEGSPGLITGNALTFNGGELHYGDVAVYMKNVISVNFFGTCIETFKVGGVEIDGGAFGVNFVGCYMERNGYDLTIPEAQRYDFKIGTTTHTYPGGAPAGPASINITGNFISDTSAAKNYAIRVIRSRALNITGNFFTGYTLGEVVVNEPTAGEARGIVSGNDREHYGPARVVLNGATLFNRTILGTTDSTPIARHITYTANGVDLASIAANTETDVTFTIAGVETGDHVTAHPLGMLPAGLGVTGVGVTATDTVKVRVRNMTATAIDPPAQSWRFRIWR